MNDRHDAIYKALADGHRRAIMDNLCRGPLVAGELAQRVGLAPNALSFHLKWLKSAGLVSAARQGRFLCYRSNLGSLTAWKDHVQAAFEPIPARTSAPSVAHEPNSTTMQTTPAERMDDILPTELL